MPIILIRTTRRPRSQGHQEASGITEAKNGHRRHDDTFPERGTETHELLAAIHEQGRQTLELVGTIVSLLMPKEGGREGPTLEELLAKLLSQQQQIIMIGKATQADVDWLGKALPDAVPKRSMAIGPSVHDEFPQDRLRIQGAVVPSLFHRGYAGTYPSSGVDAAGRQLDDGGRLTAYYTGRDSRASGDPTCRRQSQKRRHDPQHMPRDAALSRLFEGRRADTGEAWSKHPRKLSGFDLVFSPHGSVTLAAEFAATPAESAALWNAIDRANDAAMRYAAQILGWARKGAGGEDGADPGAVGWVSFRHHTARPTFADSRRHRGRDLPCGRSGRR